MTSGATSSSAAGAEISVLGQALLGLLARTPSTGYGLAGQLRHPVAFFWEARHSQIYPELARLDEAGLVTHRDVPGRGPRQTKEYRLTPAGRRAHKAWALGTVDQPVRDVETLHVWSLWMVADPVRVATWVRHRREFRARQLADFESERDLIVAGGHTLPGQPNWSNLAAVEIGIHGARAGIAWCDWMLTEHLRA